MTVKNGRYSVLVVVGLIGSAPAVLAQGVGPKAEPDWSLPVHDDVTNSLLLVDRFEYQDGDDEDVFAWEGQAWWGGDTHRLVVDSEGEALVSGGDGGEVESFDVQYGYGFSSYWQAKAGLGYQSTFGPGSDRDRASAVVGVQGLAPYWFEVDTGLRVSEDGDAVAEFEGEYDWLFTQRLILQGRAETSYAFDEVPEFGVGEGLNGLTLGLRLRYELMREFAPYVGIRWQDQYGDTADLTRAEGEDTEKTSLVAGVRWWF